MRILLNTVSRKLETAIKDSLEHTEDNYKPSKWYKPSSSRCIRQMYFIRVGVERDVQDISYQFKGILDSGTDRHLRLQKAIIDSPEIEWVDIASDSFTAGGRKDKLKVMSVRGFEVHLFDTQYKLSFMVDGVLKIDGEYVLLEIKTEASSRFYKHTHIHEEHLDQIRCYCLALGISKVVFVYENRDTLEIKCVEADITPKAVEEIRDKLLTCEDMVACKEIPNRPAESFSNTSYCLYCAYKKTCKGTKNAKK